MVLKTDNLRIKRNIDAHSRKCCCSGKAKCITYSEFMCEDLVTQNAMRFFSAQHYVITCGLSGSSIFFAHCLKNGTIFGGEKIY